MIKKCLAGLMIGTMILNCDINNCLAGLIMESDKQASFSNVNDLGDLIYSDDGIKVYGKIKQASYIDEFGKEHQLNVKDIDLKCGLTPDKSVKNVKSGSGIKKLNDRRWMDIKYTRNDSLKGTAIKIGSVDNKNSHDPCTFKYSREHSWTCTKSVSGSVDVKLLKETLGVSYADSYKTTVEYTFTVSPGRAYNFWMAPIGTRYNWEQCEHLDSSTEGISCS